MALRIVSLDQAVAGSFGGKGDGLVRLLRAGAPVPDAVLVSPTRDGPAAWDAADQARFREAVAPLLAHGPVAVRSSAVGEDSAERSFAGLFETVLGVRDFDEVLTAAARCIASGGSERVRSYAGGAEAVPVGLVVQRQVDARSAGVCFTRDPTGRDRAAVIEAVAGLGDRLVSGHAQPERWRVHRTGLGTLDARHEAGPAPVLTEAEARAIAKEALRLETALDTPLDLEWAIDAARTSWLQARPITAAVEPPPLVVKRAAPAGDDGPVTVWSNFNVRETMPDPFTPMNWSLWRDVVLPSVGEDIFGVPRGSELMHDYLGIDLVNGRLYWNMNALLAGPMALIFMRGEHGALRALDVEAAQLTAQLRAKGVLRPRRTARRFRLALQAAWSGVRSVVRLFAAARPRRMLARLREAASTVRSRPPVTTLSDEALLAEAVLFGDPICLPFRASMQTMAFGFFVLEAARMAFASHPRARGLLTAGILGPTTEISLGVDRLAEGAEPLAAELLETSTMGELRDRLLATAEGRAWLAALEGFLEQNGQRCPREFEIATPRWAEDPTMILELVRSTLRAGSSATASERLSRARSDRYAAVADALAAAPAWKRPLMRALARQVTEFMPLREAPKHYTMHLFLRMRGALLEIGRRLHERGLLAAADDVMYLEMSEAREALLGAALPDLRTRVEDRRREGEAFAKRRAPHFVRSDGVPVDVPRVIAADGSLAGVGVCGGTATGPVRVLRTPDPSRLQPGDVLVVEFADPGWTPLFPRAGAVVMEVGGVMCHAAVVVRELGIPAVFGVSGATALADGVLVTVDGDRGTVTPC